MRRVLVTGAPRSGTTWIGRTLCLSGELGEVYEPFNPRAHQARWFDPDHFYLCVNRDNEQPYLQPVEDLSRWRFNIVQALSAARSKHDVRVAARTWRMASEHRRNQRGVLIKDPLALFSAPWLADRFQFRPIVIVRHPAAFVSSLLRVGWQVRFESWLRQETLMTTWLSPWAAELERARRRPRDIVRDGALFWAVCNDVILRYRAMNPDWIVVTHESIAADPVRKFAQLYDDVGLTWSDKVQAEIERTTEGTGTVGVGDSRQHVLTRDSRQVVREWQGRLSGEDVALIRDVTESTAAEFYDADTWS